MSFELRKVSKAEAAEMAGPMELDLLAAFMCMRDDMMELVYRAQDEGWSPERLQAELELVLEVKDAGTETGRVSL